MMRTMWEQLARRYDEWASTDWSVEFEATPEQERATPLLFSGICAQLRVRDITFEHPEFARVREVAGRLWFSEETPVLAYWWPRDTAGARERAAFCRLMAATAEEWPSGDAIIAQFREDSRPAAGGPVYLTIRGSRPDTTFLSVRSS